MIASGPDLFFETRVPNKCEMSNLSVIELTAPHWDNSTLNMPLTVDHNTKYCTFTALSGLSESATLLGSASSSLDCPVLPIALYREVIRSSMDPG